MAQPSVASFFNNRKRTAVEDTKLNQARKVLILDNHKGVEKRGLEGGKSIITHLKGEPIDSSDDLSLFKQAKKLQDSKEQLQTNKIVHTTSSTLLSKEKNAPKKPVQSTRKKKLKAVANNKDIQQLLNNMSKVLDKPKPAETVVKKETLLKEETMVTSDTTSIPQETTEIKQDVTEESKDSFITPPNTPTKQNTVDQLRKLQEGPSLKELRNKMTRSSRLQELRASIARFQEGDKKLSEIEKKTSKIPDSPKLKEFRTIELQIQTSPKKLFSPEKAYLSPKKDGAGVRKNLMNFLSPSPTKNAVALSTHSPAKEVLQETTKPALTLPFKYRFLAEMFRAIDTVSQILFNRKETITFRKLKPAVEEMLKRNLHEKHLAQIMTLYPDSFTIKLEKLKIMGSGMKAERWEMVLRPVLNDDSTDHMTSEHLLQRRRKLFNILLDKVKDYHEEFLQSLDTPLIIPKATITRWHPEFDIEKVPDIEASPLPQPPEQDKMTSGRDVLERARVLFNCNTRMEHALQKLKEAKEQNKPLPPQCETPTMPESVLKGIPKALLEKVRQKQAAKALVSMTRSVEQEKELQIYSRLPDLTRLTRNVFVSEKKAVLPLETLLDKLGKCYRGNLTKAEMENHLRVIAKEVPTWLVFHDIRKCLYVKINKNADLSLVVSKFEKLVKEKSES